jgi:hypothetical protein
MARTSLRTGKDIMLSEPVRLCPHAHQYDVELTASTVNRRTKLTS